MRESPNEDSFDSGLPDWARSLLQEPAHSRADSRAAIMERVRREPVRSRMHGRLQPFMRASRWTRRGLLTPAGAAALAGVLGLFLSVRSIVSLDGGRGAAGVSMQAIVLGDTVMPSLHDSLHDSLRNGLRDTLRVVEFVLRGPSVRAASVVGDFNAWRDGATPLDRSADGAFRARVVVPRDMVRFAYVVNGDARPHDPHATVPAASRALLRARIDSI